VKVLAHTPNLDSGTQGDEPKLGMHAELGSSTVVVMMTEFLV
jgi:hypothetical protein